MQFLLMLYADEKAGSEIPAEDMAGAMDAMSAYQEALTKAGAFIATAALERTWEARTMRIEGGEIVQRDGSFVNEGGELQVHDGPYADIREQFGGYFIIEAADMDTALKWAARCPAVQWGAIEVRPYVPDTDHRDAISRTAVEMPSGAPSL